MANQSVSLPYRICKEELKMESVKHYGKEQCYAEKIPYQVLIASHIKECVKCLRDKHEDQAYDVNNGLLLSPNMDSYFDKHDISFDDNGKILFGYRVHPEVKAMYVDYVIDKPLLNKHRLKYLAYHRKQFYKKQDEIKALF